MRSSNEIAESRLDLDAYIDLVRDVLKMKKNLCVGRRFNMLNKETLRQKTTPIYIDVWPVFKHFFSQIKSLKIFLLIFKILKLNFLMPESCTQLDSTCLFMLQLACILNMVSVWKRATVRVFLCTDNSDLTENSRRKSRLDDLLNQLRIHSLTSLIPMENVKNLLNRPVISESDLPHYQLASTNLEILNVSDIYLKAANQLIKQHSESASLCFLYMPPPPALKRHQNLNTSSLINDSSIFNGSASSSNLLQEQMVHQQQDLELNQTTAFITTSQDTNDDNNKRYMRILETLSDSLPPCLFVNGVSCVTSTHL